MAVVESFEAFVNHRLRGVGFARCPHALPQVCELGAVVSQPVKHRYCLAVNVCTQVPVLSWCVFLHLSSATGATFLLPNVEGI